MKKTIFLLGCVLISTGFLLAQQDIFKKYGHKKEMLTLSKGKYQEVFKNDEVVQIGTVLLNTKTNKILKLLQEDTTKTNYNAELSSRFLTIDPLAEKYYNISPYAFCANNPVLYVDPDGLSHYSINPNGDIVMTKQTDDKFDMLYVVDKKGNINDKIEALKVNDQTILSGLSTDREGTSDNYTKTSSTEVGNVFEFAANNSNVEWGMQGVKTKNGIEYVLATSHDVDGVNIDGARSKLGFTESQIKFDLHSHPGDGGTFEGSRGASHVPGTIDDMYRINTRSNADYRSGTYNASTFPRYFVYHKKSKTLYQYTPYENSLNIGIVKGTLFKLIRNTPYSSVYKKP